MIDSLLTQIFSNQWRVIVIVSILLLAVTELGFRFGLRVYRAKDEARKGQVSVVLAAILGLLGLLLAFTYAMAADRFESRRALVLADANAIGTTFLRASLLPDVHRQAVERLLRRYVDTRLDFHAAAGDKARQSAALHTAEEIQRELWSHAVMASKSAPTPLTVSFINALNETIDLNATRLYAFRTHVPGLVWLLVLSVAACGCSAGGYGAGASGVRGAFTSLMLPLLIAVVITLIADLDRSYGSWIGIQQQPLLDLKRDLSDGIPDSVGQNRQ